MTPEEMIKLLSLKEKTFVNLINRTLPVKIGEIARSHYRNNFRSGGFDGKRWPITKRQINGGNGAASSYSPLTSAQNHLMDNTNYSTSPGVAKIFNDTDYAAIHNKGGVITRKVSPKMRKFAWAMYYKEGGKSKPEASDRWKGLALTKKTSLRIKIPRRQFMGKSEPLNAKIMAKIKSELTNLFKS